MILTPYILKPLYKKTYSIVYLQLLSLVVVSIFWLLFKNFSAAGSACLGGISWIIPTIYFIRKFFAQKKDRTLQQITKDFLLGETIKLIISAVLIILSLKIFKVNLLGFISGYLGVVLMNLATPLIMAAR